MRFKFYLIFIVFYLAGNTQEYITPLQVNSSLANQEDVSRNHMFKSVQAPVRDTLENFFDDFSQSYNRSNMANRINWDRYQDVFINDSYVDTFLSVGVATFDALNSHGLIYEHLRSDTVQAADQLISQVVKLADKNDVFLSFYYLAGGLGDMPESNDTLVLEFSAGDNEWTPVKTFSPGNAQQYRAFIMEIPDGFKTDHFRFKLTNYVSLTMDPYYPEKRSNSDHWHIDYVVLNENRSGNDTVINDIRFTRTIHSFLKNYSTMPKYHFTNFDHGELNDTVSLGIYNGLNTDQNIFIRMEYQDQFDLSNDLQDQTGGSNIFKNSFLLKPVIINEGFLSDAYRDKAKFSTKFILKDISNDVEEINYAVNDTLFKEFYMDTYYSYDDGVPEKGYGFKGYAISGSSFATKFTSYALSDSLKYIDIFINPTSDSSNIIDHVIDLVVWNLDNETGLPADSIGGKYDVNLVDYGFGYNRFFLDEPVYIEDGDFFIGWRQVSNKYINAGYDMSRVQSVKNYINTSGSWISSNAKNVVMLRAGFGSNELTSTNNIDQIVSELSVFPNPARDYIIISGNEGFKGQTYLVNHLGQTIQAFNHEVNRINIGHLPGGMYILIQKSASETKTAKFLKYE